MVKKFVVYKGEKFWLQTTGRYYQSGRKEVSERLLHRRIWVEAFGEIPAGMQVHHKNEDWTDNDLGNLELVPESEHKSAHMTKSMADPDFRANAMRGLEVAREKAAEWHASDDGIEWHKAHGKKTWEGRAPTKASCVVCGSEFETFFPSRAKFCSRSCEQKDSFQRHKTSTGVCVLCGKEFVFNKYRKQECCSRVCSNRLRALRESSTKKE